MIARRQRRHATCALLGLVGAALTVPAAAAATPIATGLSGGGGLGPAPVTQPTTTGTGGTPVSVTGDGLTLTTMSTTMLRRQLSFSGTAAAGQPIEIEREGRSTDWTWTPTLRTTADATGAFAATWTTDQAGQFAVRAIVVSQLASAAAATPTLTVTVYRGAKATLYGPGFYGRRTACGARLTRTTIGVANRTLPCGAPISILYRGRTLTVPVIDRGPYANGANWDLTMATATALGMRGTAQIGAVALPKPGSTP